MRNIKTLFSCLFLFGMVAFGSPPAIAANQEKEVPRLQQLTPETVNDLKVFTGNERTIQDSLQVAEDFVTNAELKDLFANVQQVIKDKPDKGSSGLEWLSWSGAILLLLGTAIGYVVRYYQKKNSTPTQYSNSSPPITGAPYQERRQYH